MSESPKPTPIFERLRAKYPEKSIIHAAVSELKTREEILTFRHEYEVYLKRNASDDDSRNDPGNVADVNIGHYLVTCEEPTIHRWFEALDFNPGVVRAYTEIRESLEEVRIQIGK